jgi:Zn-dependent protease with chaperone function
MTLSYVVRLICESLSAFLLAQLVLAVAAAWVAPAVLRRSQRMKPPSAAAVLLGLRLAPCVGALLAVAALCVPSYLWLEPSAEMEEVGPAALLMAGLAALLWVLALARGGRALLKSARYARDCRRTGRVTTLGGVSATVVDSSHALLALTGVLRPRIVVSGAVLKALSPEQLEAAVRHERAHWSSRDNLKRLALVVTPVLLFRGVFRELERAWARVAEWAADDRAVAGDSRQPLALASALVRVSRLGVVAAPAPLATSLVDAGQDLEVRVDRLLNVAPSRVRRDSGRRWVAGAIFMGGAIVAALVAEPALRAVHGILEELIH